MTEVRELPLSSLFVDERNVRHGDDVDVDNLAEDIAENGVLQPIVVRKTDDGYGVVAGSRRYKASKKAGLDSMPCIVRDLDDDRAVAVSVLENHSREDVDPKEQVKAIERYFEESDRVWTEKDKKDKLTAPVSEGGFGFPRQTANDYLSILSVDKDVRTKYDLSSESDNGDAGIKGELSIKQARKVGRELSDFSAEEQEKVIQEIENKTFEESKQLVEKVSTKVENQEADDVYQALEMVEMQDGGTDPEVIVHDRTDQELLKQCQQIASNTELSDLDKLVEALNLELPENLNVDTDNFNSRRASKLDVYKIYLTVCELKEKYPEFVYNGHDVKTFRELRDFAQEGAGDLTLKETLQQWGELAVTGNLGDSDTGPNDVFDEFGSRIAGKSKESVYDWGRD